MAAILSVNLAQRRNVTIRGASVETGIYKVPTDQPCAVHAFGLAGDFRVEPRKMGEAYHAVYAYPHEHYAHWANELARDDLALGQLGENLTVTGLLETQVRVGDVLRFGTAVLAVTGPRIPCRKLDARMGARFSGRFLQSRRVGFYLSVVEPGVVRAGDGIEWLAHAEGSPTIDELVRVSQLDYWDAEALAQMLASPHLVPGWREILEDKWQRASRAERWFGLRELVVVDRVQAQGVARIELACAQGKPLPSFDAGQHLVVQYRTPEHEGPVRRVLCLAGPSEQPRTYRVAVQAQAADGSDGSFNTSAHVFGLGVGDRIRAVAPTGFMTLFPMPQGCDRVVVVAEGLGLASLLSVVDAWGRWPSRTSLDVFYRDDPRARFVGRDGLHGLGTELSMLVAQSGASLRVAHDGSWLAQLESWLAPTVLGAPLVLAVGSDAFVDSIHEVAHRAGLDRSRVRSERLGVAA